MRTGIHRDAVPEATNVLLLREISGQNIHLFFRPFAASAEKKQSLRCLAYL